MKEFLCIYTGSKSKLEQWEKLNHDERIRKREEGISSWRKWSDLYKPRILSHGGPLGSAKSVSSEGIHDAHNNLAAFVIIHAQSHDEAARMFLDHPHFAIFSGDGVEIMEVIQPPTH